MTTPIDIAKLRHLEQAATPGPWDWDHYDVPMPVVIGRLGDESEDRTWLPLLTANSDFGTFGTQKDAAFIGAIRNALPQLLDELTIARAEAYGLRTQLSIVRGERNFAIDQRNAAEREMERLRSAHREIVAMFEKEYRDDHDEAPPEDLRPLQRGYDDADAVEDGFLLGLFDAAKISRRALGDE